MAKKPYSSPEQDQICEISLAMRRALADVARTQRRQPVVVAPAAATMLQPNGHYGLRQRNPLWSVIGNACTPLYSALRPEAYGDLIRGRRPSRFAEPLP